MSSLGCSSCARLCAVSLGLSIVASVAVACAPHAPAKLAAKSKPMAAAAPALEPSVAWASQVGQPVLPKHAPTANELRIEPATLVDSEYASSELVPVRRLVYRVTLILPAGMRTHRPAIAAPAGELHLDIGDQRLRARFIGPGWPIDEGSEVRLRADVPGVYLFDGAGGRPLPPGQLASWFQGEEGLRARTDVRLRHDIGAPNEGPGDLLCAFLAEWSQTSREELLPHCAGTLPPGFRCGIWSAELTAIVPLNLPRAHLRADAVDPPAPAVSRAVRDLLDPRDLERILPTMVRPTQEPAAAAVRPAQEPAAGVVRPAADVAAAGIRLAPEAAPDGVRPAPEAAGPAMGPEASTELRPGSEASSGSATVTDAAVGGEGIGVDNRTPARLVIIAQGLPLGWIKPQTSGRLLGLEPGYYRIAALRSSGLLVMPPVLTRVPVDLHFGAVPNAATRPQLKAPLLNSPEAAR